MNPTRRSGKFHVPLLLAHTHFGLTCLWGNKLPAVSKGCEQRTVMDSESGNWNQVLLHIHILSKRVLPGWKCSGLTTYIHTLFYSMEHYPISTLSRVLSRFLSFFHPMLTRQVQCRIYDPDDVGDGGSRCSSPKPAASRPCAEVGRKMEKKHRGDRKSARLWECWWLGNLFFNSKRVLAQHLGYSDFFGALRACSSRPRPFLQDILTLLCGVCVVTKSCCCPVRCRCPRLMDIQHCTESQQIFWGRHRHVGFHPWERRQSASLHHHETRLHWVMGFFVGCVSEPAWNRRCLKIVPGLQDEYIYI